MPAVRKDWCRQRSWRLPGEGQVVDAARWSKASGRGRNRRTATGQGSSTNEKSSSWKQWVRRLPSGKQRPDTPTLYAPRPDRQSGTIRAGQWIVGSRPRLPAAGPQAAMRKRPVKESSLPEWSAMGHVHPPAFGYSVTAEAGAMALNSREPLARPDRSSIR